MMLAIAMAAALGQIPVHAVLPVVAVQAAAQPAPVAPVTPPPPSGERPRAIDPGTWITQADYPFGALANNQSGMVAFRVTVSETGTVADCSVTQSSGWPLLDEHTCLLITARARFTPAQDARRRPVRGTYASRIRWILPPPTPPQAPVPPAPPAAPAG